MGLRLVRGRMRASDNVVLAVLDEEAVLLHVDSGIYFGLNVLGARIWQVLETGASEDEIVDRLLEEFEVDQQELREDVADFLTTLQEKNLLRLTEE